MFPIRNGKEPFAKIRQIHRKDRPFRIFFYHYGIENNLLQIL